MVGLVYASGAAPVAAEVAAPPTEFEAPQMRGLTPVCFPNLTFEYID